MFKSFSLRSLEGFVPKVILKAIDYVYCLVVFEDFRYEEFGRIFAADWYEESTQIAGFINYLSMTGQLKLSSNPSMFANAGTLANAVAIWEEYKAQNTLSASAQ